MHRKLLKDWSKPLSDNRLTEVIATEKIGLMRYTNEFVNLGNLAVI